MTDEISEQLTLQINLIHWMLNAVSRTRTRLFRRLLLSENFLI